jgi:hypothetical protein
MGEALGKLEAREQSKTFSTVVPMRIAPSGIATGRGLKEGSSTRPSMREPLDEGKQWASSALRSPKETVAKLYRTTRRLASDGYIDVSSASRNLTTRVGYRAAQIKEEHPLQLLAVIAGTAFVLGIAARIWRSRHHA